MKLIDQIPLDYTEFKYWVYGVEDENDDRINDLIGICFEDKCDFPLQVNCLKCDAFAKMEWFKDMMEAMYEQKPRREYKNGQWYNVYSSKKAGSLNFDWREKQMYKDGNE